ncbi:MAG: DUF6529 family protein [Planctomycetota bacterium]|jgi:hypothetical protein
MEGISIKTKTFVTLGLVVLALFEFVTAMYVYGRKGEKKNPKLVLTMHRVGGYIFLVCWLWPMIVGADLMARLSRYSDGWQFDGPRFYHAFLGVTVFILLLLKISCVRFYTNFRTSARWLGIVITVGAVVTWLVSGAFWLFAMGGRTVAG